MPPYRDSFPGHAVITATNPEAQMRGSSRKILFAGLLGTISSLTGCSEPASPGGSIDQGEPSASIALAGKKVKTIDLAQARMRAPRLTLGGPGTEYSVTISNPEAATDIQVLGEVTQGSVTHSAGGTYALCGGAVGEVPAGRCSFTWTAAAVNGNESGELVAGPATLVVKLAKVEGSDVITLDSKAIAVTIVPGTGATIGAWILFSTNVELEGSVNYNLTLWNNTGSDLNNVAFNVHIEQGTASRTAGGAVVFCPQFTGVLPPSSCTMQWEFGVSNANPGTGTLVAGPATAVLTVSRGTDVLDTRTQEITITPPT